MPSHPWARSARAVTPVLLAAATIVVAPQRARSQTVGGDIVGLASGKPVHGASVALVDDSANIVSSTAADTANGMFFIDAPHAGHYRVVLFVPGGSFVSPAMQLDSAQTIERRFSVPDVPGSFRGAYFAQDVTTPARQLRVDDPPKYPSEYAGTGMSGLVVLMFVIDEHGHVDRKSVQVINDANYLFAKAVREILGRITYVPAIKDGVAVRQVAQLSFGFGVRGNTPTADFVVQSLVDVTRPRIPTRHDTVTVLIAVPADANGRPIPVLHP